MEPRREELIRIGQLELRFYIDDKDTAGGMTVFEFTVPPQARVPSPHFHKEVDEFVYGLEGVLTFTVDGEKMEIGPGDRCFVPRGSTHHFANHGTTGVRALSMLSPASIGPEFFRAMSGLVGAGGPPDAEKMKSVMLRHGLVAVPDPASTTPAASTQRPPREENR